MASVSANWNDSTNNLLRALLCTPNFGYMSMYAVSLWWQFQPIALGNPIGYGLQHTANSPSAPEELEVYLSLLGDPTLRLQILAPPANVQAAVVQSAVQITWQPTLESGIQYFVYRSTNGISGSFNRLTSVPIAASIFSDVSPPSGPKHYQVRALKLISTGSGTFTNLSQGNFVYTN